MKSSTTKALSFALVGVAALLLAPGLAPDSLPGSAVVNGFAFEFFLAMLALSLASLSPMRLAPRLGLGPGRLPGGIIAVSALGTLSLSFALDGIYASGGFDEGSAFAQFESELVGIRGWGIAAAFGGFALAPGIAEELLCRGLIQRGLVERFRPSIAIGLAALLFGALHVEPAYAMLASVLGLYLGLIAHLAHSIRPSIICHTANNAVAVLAAAYGMEFDVGWSAITLAVMASAAAIYAVSRGREPIREPDPRAGSLAPEIGAPVDPTGLQPGSGSDDS